MNTKPNADHGTAAPQNAGAQMIDLDAIKQRANAATEGPWEDFTPHSDAERFSASVGMASLMDDIALNILSNRDAEFIAAARTDIPALIAEVERLRGRIEALHPREVIAVHEGYGEEAMCVTCKRHYPCPSIIALEDQ